MPSQQFLPLADRADARRIACANHGVPAGSDCAHVSDRAPAICGWRRAAAVIAGYPAVIANGKPIAN